MSNDYTADELTATENAREIALQSAKQWLERTRVLEKALEGQHEYHLHGFAYYKPGSMGHESAFLELCEIDEALGRTCHVRAVDTLDEAVKR